MKLKPYLPPTLNPISMLGFFLRLSSLRCMITRSQMARFMFVLFSILWLTLFAVRTSVAIVGDGYADVVLEFYDSETGPIPGPYGGTDLEGPIEVNLNVVLGKEMSQNPSYYDFLSLPTGSFVTVGFTDESIVDRPGDDIFIKEIGAAYETANVFISSDGTNFTFLGTANGGATTSFDLKSINFTANVSAVKIVGLDDFGNSPGFDVAYVQVLPGSIAPPIVTNEEALRTYLESVNGVELVNIEDRNVSVVIAGETYRGLLAEQVTPGTSLSNIVVEPIGDLNNDGNEDFSITYPSGDKQVFYYYGILEEPSNPKLAVLLGQVTERDGTALSEVIITVLLNHQEYDKTYTLIDGTFSLAVNGGELFTLKYSKDGYLSAQRKVDTETQGFFWADDVVLTPIERPQGPTVDLSATNTEPMQVVQEPLVEKDRPSRQGTLFFPQGTTATLADGTTQLDVSITEYTVDDDDLAAMPVPLPSGRLPSGSDYASGYTYAVNISANGETDVQLSQPIPFYVDNFLGFPIGTTVPLGRLDELDENDENAELEWVPATDGRVIKILSIDEGLATLDTKGDVADNDLDISEPERLAIANQFQEGETFWRIVIDKLGDFDLNWPLRIRDGLNVEEGEITSTASKLLDIDENPCVKSGCIIEAERQVLGEIIPVVGVPFNLNYRSSRTSGRYASYQLDIPLQDSSVDTPKRIKLEVSIGGQRISKVFFDKSPDKSLDEQPDGPLNTPRYTYEWDGKDGYRSLHGQGRHKATVRIGYVYNGEYEVPPEITQSLIDSDAIQCSTENLDNSDEPIGSFGCIETTKDPTKIYSSIPARQEVTDWHKYTININSWFPRSTGLGEWTIDIHHVYDPNGEVLYLGNGGLRQVAPIKQKNGKILIASEDGGLVYEFSETGSHSRTIDSLTNQAIYTFSYDDDDYLVKIEDIDGDMTTIERDADKPLAIIAPYGQRTELTLNNGYLAKVKNPAAEIHQMVYTADGLLIQFTNPLGNVANYTYDAFGLLLEDTDFAGGGWTLARTENENPEENGYLVTMTSKEGRVSGFNVATLDDGIFQRVTSAPDGTKTIVTRETEDNNKFSTSERADGTTITLEEGPEPGRFGMQSPLPTNLMVETPNRLISIITTERIPELADENNPLSLQKLTEKVTVNGRTSSSVYDVSAKKMTATSAAGRESVSYLDDKGRVIREHTPHLADVHSSYDERGRLIETKVGDGLDARTATISYDENGYISKVTDALDREVSFVYDAVGRVTTQVLTDGREIRYSYDANGNVTSITPPDRPAHDFAYTPMDLQSQYTPPALADVSEP
ncbi:MAG: RHS repeat protein, partial [Thiomargarita sp.]|nr:RHS repeat protein [Thiomargarita sp.]